MSTTEELRSRFPSIEWDEPVRIKVPGGPPGRWVCRFCIALHGLKAAEIDACPFAYATRLDARKHIVTSHGEEQ